MNIEVRTVDGHTDSYNDLAYNEEVEAEARKSSEGKYGSHFICQFYPVVNDKGDLFIVRDMQPTQYMSERCTPPDPWLVEYAYYPSGGWVRVLPQPQVLAGYEPPTYRSGAKQDAEEIPTIHSTDRI